MTAKQLTDSILQLAIQGKLVPQDPNDEPASVLLDKIREEKRRLVKEGKLKEKDHEETPIDEDVEPFKLPDGWMWSKFFSVFQLETNLVSPTLYLDYPHVAPDNIEKSTGRLIGFRTVNEDKVKSNNHLFHKGQILYSKIRPLLRKAIIAPFDGLCSADMYPLSSSLSINYALYYLLSDVFNKQVCDICSSRVKMPKINQNELSSIMVPIPPLAEQHRIVERIEEILPFVKEYGEAYEEASKMDAEMPDKLKKSILQEAIMGKLGTQDPNDEHASVLLDKIRAEKKKLVKEGVLKKKDLLEAPIAGDEKPFKIPENWKWHRLGKVTYMYTGNSISESEKSAKYTNVDGLNYIGTKDVQFDHSIDYDNGIRIPLNYQDKFKKAPSGSILMCIEGGSAGRKIGILNEEVCFGNKLCCFIPVCVYNKYVYYYLQSPTLKELFKSNLNGIIGGVSIAKLSPLLIPLPPLAEQHRIVEKIEKLFAEIDNMTINNNDLNETKTEEREE